MTVFVWSQCETCCLSLLGYNVRHVVCLCLVTVWDMFPVFTWSQCETRKLSMLGHIDIEAVFAWFRFKTCTLSLFDHSLRHVSCLCSVTFLDIEAVFAWFAWLQCDTCGLSLLGTVETWELTIESFHFMRLNCPIISLGTRSIQCCY